jgi:hypothetical protein
MGRCVNFKGDFYENARMILQKLNSIFVLVVPMLLLAACHPQNYYEPKQNCLNSVISECKQHGWHYATTNPDCKRAAEQGIYGLSCTQLRACSAAEQQAKAHR